MGAGMMKGAGLRPARTYGMSHRRRIERKRDRRRQRGRILAQSARIARAQEKKPQAGGRMRVWEANEDELKTNSFLRESYPVKRQYKKRAKCLTSA